jgi:hypothetical protein
MPFTFQALGLPEDYLMRLKAQMTPITSVTPLKKGTDVERATSDVLSKMTDEQKMQALFPGMAQAGNEQMKIQGMLEAQQRESALEETRVQMEQAKMDAFMREMDSKEAEAAEAKNERANRQAEMDRISEQIGSEGITASNIKDILATGLKTGNKDLIGLAQQFVGGNGKPITPNQHFGGLLAQEEAGTLSTVGRQQLKRWQESKLQGIDDKLEYERKKEELKLNLKYENYIKLLDEKVPHADALTRSGLAQIGSPEVQGAANKEAQKGKLEARYEFAKKMVAQGYPESQALEMAGLSQPDIFTALSGGNRQMTQPLVTPKAPPALPTAVNPVADRFKELLNKK